MAEEHLAQPASARWPWTRIFNGFRVALDLKKLLLAAAGIFVTAAGWWAFSSLFYSTSRMPEWKDYAPADAKEVEARRNAFSALKRDRERWNVLHEMAGPVPADSKDVVRVDAVDLAKDYDEYELLDGWQRAFGKERTLAQIELEAVANKEALRKFHELLNPPAKRAGKLRSWPWFEDRGANQYLLATGLLRGEVPWGPGHSFNWLFSEQLPVLMEPLVKFLAPIGYFFDSRVGGFMMRVYLFLVILWTLAVWGFFGGAICRIAAVQVARNEKISMREAVGFAREKFINLFTAPLFPLIFLGILTFFLALFGLIEGYTFAFGDIVLDGFLWPVVIILGLIMAVVIVGLVGWPLMNPTIAAEGSDNFDALSRSYSYVYQAFWHYLWYWSVALVYGAALIFFVGFMGSLVVYMGKWGMSRAPGLVSADPGSDREPSYLFLYAPTSYGWRDLLIRDSQHVDPVPVTTAGGFRINSYQFTERYQDKISPPNRIGAFLVAVWIYLFFLLIVGFGYSYFWTASTIIYFLMRKHVDDTEMEEVYFEEGDLEPPANSVTASTAAPAAKPNTMSLNVVEGPAPATVVIATPTAPAPTAAPPPNPPTP